MKWGSSCKTPTYLFECMICSLVDGDPLGYKRFVALHTPATCPFGCNNQYTHIVDTRKGSSIVSKTKVEQLHLR